MFPWRVLVVLVVALAPTTAQGLVTIDGTGTLTVHEPTTLFFHALGSRDMPMNTQAPAQDWESTDDAPLAPSVPCTELGGAPAARFQTWYGYSSPQVVDYANRTAGGTPRIHSDRGTLHGVEFGSTDLLLHWYLLVGVAAALPDGDATWSMAPMANLQVQATMRLGAALGVDDEAYNVGAIVAQGETDPVTVAGEQVVGGTQVRPVRQVGDAWVYEFTVPLRLESRALPDGGSGFNVRVDASFDAPECQGAMLPTVAVHTSEDARPRLVLDVLDPLRFGYLAAQVVGEDLVVHHKVDSPWGPYDVDAASLRVTIEGPADLPAVAWDVEAGTQQGHYHYWDGFRASGVFHDVELPPGSYAVEVSVANRQGTATLVATTQFEVAGSQEAPLPSAASLIGALALALVLRRR